MKKFTLFLAIHLATQSCKKEKVAHLFRATCDREISGNVALVTADETGVYVLIPKRTVIGAIRIQDAAGRRAEATFEQVAAQYEGGEARDGTDRREVKININFKHVVLSDCCEVAGYVQEI